MELSLGQRRYGIPVVILINERKPKLRIPSLVDGLDGEFVIYNIDNNNAVKMESYLDDKANNKWIKVTDLIDNGGWYLNSPDSVFYSANCGKPKDYVITNGGPIITFRSDNMVSDSRFECKRNSIPHKLIRHGIWLIIALSKMMDIFCNLTWYRISSFYKVSFFH